jgi:3-hydroxybutyryl-CoA dehydrogenase
MIAKKTTVIVGGGTMGIDIALTLARAGCATHLVEPDNARRAALPALCAAGLADLGCPGALARIAFHATLDEIPWPAVDAVIEAIPERLDIKRRLFAELVRLARPDALLTSNSSALPISRIAEGLPTRERMFGLHYFMPAQWVPLVEVVCAAESDPARADELCDFMRATGKVPVKVKKDVPGFLANRLQHALCREAFALLEAGVATAEDIDLAVRFGFGLRFLAVGPIRQRDYAGLDVHCAAATTIYPEIAAGKVPARVLREHVAAGHLGIKSGRGFFEWTPEKAARDKARYDALLKAALGLLADELPEVES